MNKSEIKVIKRDAVELRTNTPRDSTKAAWRKGAIEVNNWIDERRENNRLESVHLAEYLSTWHTSGK